MFDEKTLEQIQIGLQRIFSMKVTRTTYREIQNLLMAVTQNQQEKADKLFQAIATGVANEDLVDGKGLQKLNKIIENYSVSIRLAREVMERGEFVNLLTSDALNSNERILFLNRIRRIDGEEFQFVTDATSTVHILQHFVSRIQELQKSDEGKKMIAELSSEISNIQKLLSQIVNTTT